VSEARAWETDLTVGAVRQKNISLEGSPFFLAPYRGGSNEAKAPNKRLKVTFRNGPTVEMWIYGDKKILTPRVGAVAEFFKANNILEGRAARLRITQVTPGELLIEKAV
jgi:hypothetical protein